MEVPLSTHTGEHLGYFDEDVLRGYLSRQEASLIRSRDGTQRRVVMKPGTTPPRTKALSSQGATQSLSTTYTEDLYPDGPDVVQLAKIERRELTVTGTLLTMKKYRPNIGFVKWSGNERFARKRFNPDNLRPLFPSESAMRLS